jgi:Holliday junction resolvasome RuvABC endonuclease subunit
MKSLGLDLSLTSTGWAMIEWYEEHWRLIDGGVIKPKMDGVERLWYIRSAVRELLPDTASETATGYRVAMEGPSFGYAPRQTGENSPGITRAVATGELFGVIKTLLYRLDVPCVVIPPAKCRKVALYKAYAKGDISREVLKRYGVEFAHGDTTDAFVVAVADYLIQAERDAPQIPFDRRRLQPAYDHADQEAI